MQRDDFLQAAPAQLSQQCSDNLLLREGLIKLNHSPQILLGEPLTELSGPISSYSRDDLTAVLGLILPQDLLKIARVDAPIKSTGNRPGRPGE